MPDLQWLTDAGVRGQARTITNQFREPLSIIEKRHSRYFAHLCDQRGRPIRLRAGCYCNTFVFIYFSQVEHMIATIDCRLPCLSISSAQRLDVHHMLEIEQATLSLVNREDASFVPTEA